MTSALRLCKRGTWLPFIFTTKQKSRKGVRGHLVFISRQLENFHRSGGIVNLKRKVPKCDLSILCARLESSKQHLQYVFEDQDTASCALTVDVAASHT
jgi:hypothetical protein